ncbi:MAG: hypothetical protein AAB836_01870 [Patescibacteria group bacterium]
MKNTLPALALITACNDFDQLPIESQREIIQLEGEFLAEARFGSKTMMPADAPDYCKSENYFNSLGRSLQARCEYILNSKHPNSDATMVMRDNIVTDTIKKNDGDILKSLSEVDCNLDVETITKIQERDEEYMSRVSVSCDEYRRENDTLSKIVGKRTDIIQKAGCDDNSEWRAEIGFTGMNTYITTHVSCD